MTLSAVITGFIEATGRADLNNSSVSPSGARWYINAGQRLLDTLGDSPKSLARHVIALATGQFVVNVPLCRVITEAWIMDSSGRAQLERKSEKWIRANYTQFYDPTGAPIQVVADSVYRGTPAYYTVTAGGLSPSQNVLTQEDKYGLEGVTVIDYYNSNNVLILPPPDAAFSLILLGHFFSTDLSNGDDKSFWTETWPQALIVAACYSLEQFMRNREGMRDHMDTLREMLLGIAQDRAEEDIAAGGLVMEG